MDHDGAVRDYRSYWRELDSLRKAIHSEGQKLAQADAALAAHRAKLAAGTRPNVGDANDAQILRWAPRRKRAADRIERYEATLAELVARPPTAP